MPIPCATERATRTACARAARRLGVVLRVRPQLERDRHGALPRQQRGDGGVDPAAHRHQRAAGVGRERGLRVRGAAERAVQRVGDQVGGVELARREPAELRRRSSCAPTRAASSSGSPSTSVTAAEAAAVSAPQPEASKPARATRSPSTRSVIRIRSPQAAPPAAPSWPPATAHAAPGGRAQVLGEALAVHAAESRRRGPSGSALAVRDAGGGAGVRELAVQARRPRRAAPCRRRPSWRSCRSAARPRTSSPLASTPSTWRWIGRYLAGAFSEAKPGPVGAHQAAEAARGRA